MNFPDINDRNLAKLSDFLQLLEDQINIDGYKPKSLLPRYVLLSHSILKNRGIVIEEARSMVSIINKIGEEKVLGIINNDLISDIELKDSRGFFSDDLSLRAYYEEKYRKEIDKKIDDWIQINGKVIKIYFREDFDKILIVRIFNSKKFDDVKRLYINKPSEIQKKKSPILPRIYVNKETLWREPKAKYSYSMMEAKGRYKIFEYLSNKGNKYVETNNIAEQMGKKPGYIRSEIGKINKTFKNKLGIKINLIQASQGNGYRINPDLKIVTR